ncbi:hypothetical protein [Capnocytophaga canis]|uniref:hypothetical protein n=1 Tax=Capnocytophaga canis TaxID=1848903 RepID=UPI0015622BB2|nr:hypothetical protein [Capnocytophaga canis]
MKVVYTLLVVLCSMTIFSCEPAYKKMMKDIDITEQEIIAYADSIVELKKDIYITEDYKKWILNFKDKQVVPKIQEIKSKLNKHLQGDISNERKLALVKQSVEQISRIEYYIEQQISKAETEDFRQHRLEEHARETREYFEKLRERNKMPIEERLKKFNEENKKNEKGKFEIDLNIKTK